MPIIPSSKSIWNMIVNLLFLDLIKFTIWYNNIKAAITKKANIGYGKDIIS